MGASNGKLTSTHVAEQNVGGNDELTQSSLYVQTNPPHSRRRTTITTFDIDANRVSIVSIRYEKSPIAVGEDRSDISFESYDLAMARVFTFLDVTSLIMCSR